MVNGINEFFNNLKLNGACKEIVAIVSIFFITLVFLLVFVLSLVKVGYGLEKRNWFNKLTYAISALEFAFFGIEQAFPYLVLVVALILQMIISSIRVREIKVNKEQKTFISEIDKIKEQYFDDKKDDDKNFSANEILYKLKTISQPKIEKDNQEGIDLDFTHVKSVIDKLDYYSLSQSDRRIVNDLELNLLHAEKGDIYPDTKSKINDGLGALLKIMSKYGV